MIDSAKQYIPHLAALLVLACCMFFSATSSLAADKPYPFSDPYKATVFGTPPELAYPTAPVPLTSTRKFAIKSRSIPKIFWYADELPYAYSLQKKKAPLMFLIAGTGAGYDAGKLRFLHALFYEAGYHVVRIGSPTHFNFIVSASRYGAAGYVPHDVADLYRVMTWIAEELEKKAQISSYSVAGYSLGGMHSAFLAHQDNDIGNFHFKDVLMINPAVDLYASAMRFDSWLTPESTNGKDPMEIADSFYSQFAEFYKTRKAETLDSEVLFQLCDYLEGEESDFKALIGISFRVTAASMIFTSDVCLNAGYIVAPETELTQFDPLLPYFTAAAQRTFEQYFEQYLYPYLCHIGPTISKEEAIANCSLKSIEPFLLSATNIHVVGNADDPILNADEVRFLRRVFKNRVHLFEHGGHCGNLMYAPFARHMLTVLGKEQASHE